jgi:hypothetical protein
MRTLPPFLRRALTLALLVGGCAAPAASADTITSTNWAGFAAHRSGVHFRSVAAQWRQPRGRCTGGGARYSAFWIGIGGYSLSSQALEQIGTEFDCSSSGASEMSAWYELVPSPSASIHLTIGGGDLVAARITVKGHHISLTLADRTTHRSFSRSVTVKTVDDTSAEWIAEAPSDCTSSSSCTTLPLADFQAIGFSGARAQTTHGRSGPVASPKLWGTTKILLGYKARGATFVALTTTPNAAPSSLADGGSGFAVFSSDASSTSTTTTSTTTTSAGGGAPGGGANGPGSGGAGGYGGNPAGPGGAGGPPGGFGGRRQ